MTVRRRYTVEEANKTLPYVRAIVNDVREKHRTLLKIDRRVYSRDYVPEEVFEPDYLLDNRHVGGAATPSDRVAADTPEENGQS